MMDGLKDKYRKAIITILTDNERVEKVVLFGSRAMGTFTPTSDVDIALFGDNLTLTDQAKLAEQSGAAAVMARQHPILTYLVNRISAQGAVTPYSFVSAPGPPLVPEGLGDDDIIINEWLARDLGVGVGEQVELSYWVPSVERGLTESRASFTVSAVIPLSGAAADQGLMPLLPGLMDAENCRDWDADMPIDLELIAPRDLFVALKVTLMTLFLKSKNVETWL